MKILIPASSPLHLKSNIKYYRWMRGLKQSPIYLPYVGEIELSDNDKELIRECDGILMPGGIDVHPLLYGENVDRSMSCDITFDMWQMQIIEAGIKNKIPIFGICRGMQLIYVYLGGVLKQSVNGNSFIEHNQNTNAIKRNNPCHTVVDLFGTERPVNSLHHQAVGTKTDYLKEFIQPTLYSSDDVIEGFKAVNQKTRIRAVQFHPEELDLDYWNEYIVKFYKNIKGGK